VKTVYLDQNHWIELSRAKYRRDAQPETPSVLQALRILQQSGSACFPLSLGHYMETLKHQDPERRSRLANFMLDLSGGCTVASPDVVVCHEMQVALERCFPGRVKVEPLQFLATGLSHAADLDSSFNLEWPPEAKSIPAKQRAALEKLFQYHAARSLLSGILPTGDQLDLKLARDLSPDYRFKAGLGEWRGASSRYSPAELERRIYATTLADVSSLLLELLASNRIPVAEFEQLGESRWRAFLDDMPSRIADMHLRREWAKNANLTPRESDLNDWAYLGVAVCYCDVLVTEKQIADLFSRSFTAHATVLSRLPDLLAVLT